jgi:hypothetical protein
MPLSLGHTPATRSPPLDDQVVVEFVAMQVARLTGFEDELPQSHAVVFENDPSADVSDRVSLVLVAEAIESLLHFGSQIHENGFGGEHVGLRMGLAVVARSRP